MEKNNCLRCNFQNKGNGNCTAVGGFCTAVPAAHCPLLRQYLDTGLTPEEVLPKDKADEIALKLMRLADLESLCNYTRLRELAEADKDGRVVAHWIPFHSEVAGDIQYCSACDIGNLAKSDFCPHCGAMMDVGDDRV